MLNIQEIEKIDEMRKIIKGKLSFGSHKTSKGVACGPQIATFNMSSIVVHNRAETKTKSFNITSQSIGFVTTQVLFK